MSTLMCGEETIGQIGVNVQYPFVFIRDAGQDLSMSKWASEAIVAIANIAAESRTDLK